MCAIFRSFDKTMFEILYEANKQRGNFASSIVSIGEDDVYVAKFEGSPNMDSINYSDDCVYITGHVQAPTSAKRDWSYDTSHPFESLSWSVSHNGVLTNTHEMRERYVDFIENEVDTAVIVNMLQLFTELQHGTKPSPVNIIKDTLNQLEGTYALSIIDTDTGELYIARCGSILHYDNKGNYSTNPGTGYKELPEGVIMRLNKRTKKWNKVGVFDASSPFLFL